MAAGSDSGLSHRAGTAPWGLTREPPEPFDVTTTRRSRDGPATIRLHRPRNAPAFTRHRGVPVTTVAQTLLDFATVATQDELERAIREAHARWLITHRQIQAFASHAQGRPGAPALREALGQEGASRSRTERAFLALCRTHRLEEPIQNVRVAGVPVDFYWPQHDLVVESDGYATHASRHGFEHDHELDAHLARHGIRTQRFSDRQVGRRPNQVVSTVTALGVRYTS